MIAKVSRIPMVAQIHCLYNHVFLSAWSKFIVHVRIKEQWIQGYIPWTTNPWKPQIFYKASRIWFLQLKGSAPYLVNLVYKSTFTRLYGMIIHDISIVPVVYDTTVVFLCPFTFAQLCLALCTADGVGPGGHQWYLQAPSEAWRRMLRRRMNFVG